MASKLPRLASRFLRTSEFPSNAVRRCHNGRPGRSDRRTVAVAAGSGFLVGGGISLWFHHKKSAKLFVLEAKEAKRTEPGEIVPGLPEFRMEEVRLHDDEKSLYMTYKRGVYDVTKLLKKHPAGPGPLLDAGGMDMEQFFEKFPKHKDGHVLQWMETFRIGNLQHDDYAVNQLDLQTGGISKAVSDIPLDVVKKHDNVENRVWFTYRHGVYDLTDLLKKHPGGADVILEGAGGPLEKFWTNTDFHRWNKGILHWLETFRIGNLSEEDFKKKEEELENLE